jgi:sulfate transport system substrate-binding protein
MTFVLKEIGDVQLTWENEAIREVSDSRGKLQIVYPSVSILAEPYVAWVDANVARRGTKAVAEAYLEFLFTDPAQAIIASLGYRPYKGDAARISVVHLPKLTLFPVTAVASNWADAQQKFFAENGILDTITGSRPQ